MFGIRIFIERTVIALIKHLLVDAENVLCLGCVIDNLGRPYRPAVFIVIAARVNLAEFIGDRGVFNDLLMPEEMM